MGAVEPSNSSLKHALAALATAATAALFAWTPLHDVDWPWHLADEGRMVAEHRLPWDDRWSYASEGDHVPVHWLFELVMGGAYRLLGLDGVFAVKVGLVALAFLALHRALARKGLGPIAAASLALVVASISSARLMERPHLVTILGLVLAWDRLTAFRDRKTERLWPLVPIFVVWANAHPGVVYGSLLVVGFLVAEGLRVLVDDPKILPPSFPDVPVRALDRSRYARLVVGGTLALVATVVTPYGPRLYPYLFAHRDMQKWSHVLELRPLDFTSIQDTWFVAAVFLATLFLARAAWRSRTTPRESPVDLTDVSAAAAFCILATLAAREAVLALAVLALATAPALAATIREAKDELADKDRGLHVFAWSFALVLGFVHPIGALVEQVSSGGVGRGLERGFYPVREAEWILREKPPGPLWNSNGAGGYLLWKLEPEKNPQWKVYTDGRQPLFRTALQRTLPDVDRVFAPNLLVIDPRSIPYEADFVHLSAPFALVHFSDGGRTYVRDVPANAAWTAKAYRHVGFAPQIARGTRAGLRLTLLVDSEHPDLALKELLAGAAREEPDGHWANVGLARAFLALGRREEAADAVRRAALAKPGSAEVRELEGAFR